MARQNSRGRTAPHAAPRRALGRNSPQSARRVPPPAPAQGGNGGSLLGSIGAVIAEGMAFGSGSAIAHRAVEAVLVPLIVRHETVVSQATAARQTTTNSADSCVGHSKAFHECLNSNSSDITKCQFLLDMLSDCRRNSDGSVMGG